MNPRSEIFEAAYSRVRIIKHIITNSNSRCERWHLNELRTNAMKFYAQLDTKLCYKSSP